MKISDIKTKLESLIPKEGENLTEEVFISKIGEITKDLDDFETEYIDFLGKHEELRNKYIEVCKNVTFFTNQADKEVGEVETPPTLEKLVDDVIANRKEN